MKETKLKINGMMCRRMMKIGVKSAVSLIEGDRKSRGRP